MSIPMFTLCREKLAVRGGHLRDGGFTRSSSLTGAVPRMTQSGRPKGYRESRWPVSLRQMLAIA